MKVQWYLNYLLYLQGPLCPWIPIFGGRFVCGLVFMFFAVQSQCSFQPHANYENNLPLKIGIQGDGGLCIHVVNSLKLEPMAEADRRGIHTASAEYYTECNPCKCQVKLHL